MRQASASAFALALAALAAAMAADQAANWEPVALEACVVVWEWMGSIESI